MTKKKHTLTVIDIGSHKLEELFLLLKPAMAQYAVYAKWLFLRILKAIKRQDVSLLPGRKQLELIRYYFFKKRRYNIQVVSIEPNIDVAYKYIRGLCREYQIHYLPIVILGHDASKDCELKRLFFYNKTVSSSIYSKGGLSSKGKFMICCGLKFGALWDELVRENIVERDAPFLLRMNCEGSELGVLQECKNKNIKPLCVIGSLADVKKIHGEVLGRRLSEVLSELDIPYFYFKGADPSTWYDMIAVWERYASRYLKER